MRTTIRMKPDLARRAKAYARRRNQTFTEVVEQAVARLLEEADPDVKHLPPLTVVYGKVPVTDEQLAAAIAEMDEQHDLQRLGLANDAASRREHPHPRPSR